MSNSSSTAFVIVNKTDKPLPLIEFAKETAHLVEEFNKEFSHSTPFTVEDFLKSAEGRRGCILQSGDNYLSFGDEDYDAIGTIYDYMLRGGGETQRFKWWFDHWER